MAGCFSFGENYLVVAVLVSLAIFAGLLALAAFAGLAIFVAFAALAGLAVAVVVSAKLVEDPPISVPAITNANTAFFKVSLSVG